MPEQAIFACLTCIVRHEASHHLFSAKSALLRYQLVLMTDTIKLKKQYLTMKILVMYF